MPLLRKPAICSISSTKYVGSRQGTVMCQITCMRLAPSTLAASNRASSMPVMAAMYMMADQPSAFQVYQAHIVIHTWSDDCSHSTGASVSPMLLSRLLAMPSEENSAKASE